MRLLGAGRTADVFELDAGRVLRRYRAGWDTGGEAAVMSHLAAAGYPVPRAEPGPRPGDLVMARLEGPTMLADLIEGRMQGQRAGEVLAGLLERLHAMPARVAARPGDRILHLDLHPGNVLLTPDGPMVIDWANSEEGPPGLDWAMSALIVAQIVAVAGAPSPSPVNGVVLTADLTDGARSLLAALTGRAGRQLGEWLPEAVRRRAADPAMSPPEVSCLQEAAALIRQMARRP